MKFLMYCRLQTFVSGIFGDADPSPTLALKEQDDSASAGANGGAASGDGASGKTPNPYPENDIDEIRAVKDAALAKYIQVKMYYLIRFATAF